MNAADHCVLHHIRFGSREGAKLSRVNVFAVSHHIARRFVLVGCDNMVLHHIRKSRKL